MTDSVVVDLRQENIKIFLPGNNLNLYKATHLASALKAAAWNAAKVHGWRNKYITRKSHKPNHVNVINSTRNLHQETETHDHMHDKQQKETHTTAVMVTLSVKTSTPSILTVGGLVTLSECAQRRSATETRIVTISYFLMLRNFTLKRNITKW